LLVVAWIFSATTTLACVGDCDDDGVVTIDEVVRGIALGLGHASAAACALVDRNGDGQVTVDELTAAVTNALMGCPAASTPVPTRTPIVASLRFREVTAAAGLQFDGQTPRSPPNCLQPFESLMPLPGAECMAENLAGGAAAGDANGDGWTDLYVTQVYGPDLLYLNVGDGTFVENGVDAGIALDLSTNGVVWGDVDADGDLDIYVTTIGETRNLLFINDGSGRFTEEGVERNAAVFTGDPHYGMGAAFGDYDRDGYPDIYTTDWNHVFGTVTPPAIHSRLLRNLGATKPGYFEDTTELAGVRLDLAAGIIRDGEAVPEGVFTFAPAFVDLDADGWQDLAIAADAGTTALFWNRGDGTFVRDDQEILRGDVRSDMGSTFGDIDGDGDFDWFLTNITCEGPYSMPAFFSSGCSRNQLLRNDGQRRFSQHPSAVDVEIGYWGWGAVFFDADNDGDLDLAQTNGIEIPGEFGDFYIGTAYATDPMRFWRNDDVRFTEMSAAVGLISTGKGKGILVFDYDRDGDLDLYVANSNAAGQLFRNDTIASGNWLRVKVAGPPSYGATISLTHRDGDPPQVREVGVASHFLGQSEDIAHFGLGPTSHPIESVVISWPSTGGIMHLESVAHGAEIVVRDPSRTDP